MMMTKNWHVFVCLLDLITIRYSTEIQPCYCYSSDICRKQKHKLWYYKLCYMNFMNQQWQNVTFDYFVIQTFQNIAKKKSNYITVITVERTNIWMFACVRMWSVQIKQLFCFSQKYWHPSRCIHKYLSVSLTTCCCWNF